MRKRCSWREFYKTRLAYRFRLATATLGFTIALKFAPAHAADLRVNSLADDVTAADGLVTLREAVVAANTNTATDLGDVGAGADRIIFDPTLFAGTPVTIPLTLGELALTESVIISGPGADVLNVSGGNASRVFFVNTPGGTVSIDNLAVVNGSGPYGYDGGGIRLQAGTLNLLNCAVFNNRTNGAFSHGAGLGIRPGTAANVSGCAFFGNVSSGRGGGISSYSPLNLANCTISGNTGTQGGGGIYLYNTPAVSIDNSTIALNTATAPTPGGGILAIDSTPSLSLRSSLVANNVAPGAGPDINGTVLATNSLIRAIAGVTFDPGSSGNVIVQDPLLRPPTNNGGRTLTHGLQAGSPAIDAGANPGSLATDQRGVARAMGALTDIGAVETFPDGQGFVVDTVADENDGNFDAGDLSLREAVLLSNGDPGADNITFAAGLTGTTLVTAPLFIGDAVIITGPGADQLTLDGNDSTTIIYIGNGAATEISGLTFTGAYGIGGAIAAQSDLTLTDCVLTENIGYGGAILSVNGTLTVERCTISSNTGIYGGGIGCLGDSATLTDCTIADNQSGLFYAPIAFGGGILAFCPLTMERCTVSGNSAGMATAMIAFGGGIDCRNTTVLTNCTITDNETNAPMSAGGAGIGHATTYGSGLTLNNCTITGNRDLGTGAQSGGGGLRLFTYLGTETITLNSTIIAGNTVIDPADGPDLNTTGIATGSVNAVNSLFGVLNAAGVLATDTNNIKGTEAAPVNALLGPLQNNGGPTLTHAPLVDSPAIDAGANPANLTTDQRGDGFPRLLDSAVDIGAVEIDLTAPTAALLNAPNVTNASSATEFDFTVTFTDNNAIDVATLDNLDLRVTGPNGFDQLATLVAVDNPNNGTPRVATFRLIPPGGTWDLADNGTYTIAIEASQVADTAGLFVATGTLGTFTVDRGLPGDADGDGWSDAVETALNSDPNNAGSSPFGLPAPIPSAGLTIKKITLKKRTAAANDDMLIVQGEFPNAGGIRVQGKTAVFDIEGIIRGFALDQRGSSPKVDGDFFRLTRTLKGSTKSGKFTLTLRNGSFTTLPNTVNVKAYFNGKSYSTPAKVLRR